MAYPLTVTFGALAVIAAWAPFADLDQVSALVTVALGILGYTGYRVSTALGWVPSGPGRQRTVPVRRVRQQHRLVSRSWLEVGDGGRTRWVPVYFDPRLVALTGGDAHITAKRITIGELRLYPSGRFRDTEPPGRLVDNPSRPAPDAAERAATAAKPARRLLLDAQSAVAAPFAALLWVYVANGGVPAFAGATCVAAVTAIWLSAIRGSDPS
nr:hypothetical protein [Nocardia donostiensis]